MKKTVGTRIIESLNQFADALENRAVMYSEWISKDGKFHRHHAYRTIYPKNASRAAEPVGA